MTTSEALLQLARLTGRDEFLRHTGLDEGLASGELDTRQRALLEGWIDERHAELVRGLLNEAMACDDVQDPESARAYLDDRLSFLGDLLTPTQRQRIRDGLVEAVRTWT